MGCGTSFVKYVLFFFNLLVALLGLGIIGIGVAFLLNWTVVKDELKSQLTVAPWVFIVIGAIMFVIAFFGCCGAIRESHCMVVTYSIFLLVIIIVQVVLAVLLFTYGDTLKEGIVTSVRTLFDKQQSANVDKATETIINNLQQQFSCCGSDGPQTYGLTPTLPDSCCARDPSVLGTILGNKCTIENANAGCANTLARLYEKWNKPIAGVAIGVACIEMCMTQWTMRLMRPNSHYPHTPDLEGEASSQEDSSNVVAAFQEALGVEYEDCTKFEGVIQTEISKRWNHVLINGLPKDEKDSILKKYKLPENCQLLEAPILNEEVKSVMTENSKIRDRSLEMVQHQLGMATAVIGQVMTYLIENKDIDKIQLVTKLTDASKLLNDIHFQKTRTRRQLISPLLDKNFICLVEKVKRDEHLYGMDLGTKIKTSQDLKKSSSQIKKAVTRPMPNKPAPRNKPVGNRYGPPRTQTNQQTRTMAPRGGPRNRVSQPPPQRSGYSHPRPERAAPRGHHSKR